MTILPGRIRTHLRLPLAAVLTAGSAMAPTGASADCVSACDSRYHSCTSSFNERDCATQRWTCTNRCYRYGAIVYSPSTGVYGTSRRLDSREAAEQAALRDCRQRKGTDCEKSIYFDKHCGALAKASDGAWGLDGGPSQAIARRTALAECQRHTRQTCHIEVSLCSP